MKTYVLNVLNVLDMDGKLLGLSHSFLCIAKLVNLSIANGNFPSEFKLAKVTPIY